MPKDQIYSRDTIIKEDISMNLLIEAQRISAEVVKRHGDKYLPIFIKIHNEIKKIESDQSYKKLALQILKYETYS